MLKCSRCSREISESDSFQHLNQILCDDCYMDVRNQPKACDPWAVYAATRSKQNSGMNETDGLTPLQQSIYKLIQEKGRVTRDEIISSFGLKEIELQSQIATLRHLELVKGSKDGDKVYFVPF